MYVHKYVKNKNLQTDCDLKRKRNRNTIMFKKKKKRKKNLDPHNFLMLHDKEKSLWYLIGNRQKYATAYIDRAFK